MTNEIQSKSLIIQLVIDIKKKKELKELSDEFVKKELDNYLKQNSKLNKLVLDNKLNQKSSNYKKIIKEVRSKLRRAYGLFRTKQESDKIEKLFKEYLETNDKKTFKEILLTHSSTRERLGFYKELYKKIFSITGKPKKILDLGAGINPLSIKFMNLNKLNYFSYDLGKWEVKLLNKFYEHLQLENNEIIGKAGILDILNFDKVKKLQKVDICFLFKMTDVLDKGKGHKKSEELIKSINSNYVVISFPTVTMSNKRMNFPRRKWIELMSERLGYSYDIFEISCEIFYVIKKY